MTDLSSWRSLSSVMLVTVHVAAVAYVFRTFSSPSSLRGLMVWVPMTISVAVFLSWPIGRAVASAFDPGEIEVDRTCPRCGRSEIRALIRPGGGLFQPISGYRCAACRTTYRVELGSRTVSECPPEAAPTDPSGISYLSDLLDEGDIRFLDEPAKSPGGP